MTLETWEPLEAEFVTVTPSASERSGRGSSLRISSGNNLRLRVAREYRGNLAAGVGVLQSGPDTVERTAGSGDRT
jgi:hypothetical protein